MASTSRNGATRTAASDDDEYDPVAFQAALDESVSETRALVASWLPENLGREWDTDALSGKTGTEGLQSLKDRARPPRLGLGAQPASLHKQQAEDRKIASRLLRGRSLAMGDEGSNVATPVAGASGTGRRDGSDASSDDEDSRSRAVGKGKAKANGTAYNNPFVIPSKTSKNASMNGTPTKGSQKPPLFNDPSPVKPAPSTSTPIGLTAPIAAASSFYGGAGTSAQGGTNGVSHGPQGLTKNQRKKERERIKREEERRRREEESRAEAMEEAASPGVTGAGQASGEASRKRAREGDGLGHEAEGEDGSEDVQGADTPSAPPSPTKSLDGAGSTGGAGDSPKKRRKKKKRNSVVDSQEPVEAAPLLNLAPIT